DFRSASRHARPAESGHCANETSLATAALVSSAAEGQLLFSVAADLHGGRNGARAGSAGPFAGGNNLHPERVLALVVRGGSGSAQRIEAVLRRARGRGGESRQLKDYPRALLQLDRKSTRLNSS